MQIFNVGNNSVNLYLLISSTHNILIDSGFPGTLKDLGRKLREANSKLQDLDYLLVTHFHPDHAGLVQDLKNESAKFVIVDFQVPFIGKMEREKGKLLAIRKYTPLDHRENICISLSQSRSFLMQVGLSGEIIAARSHSADGITVVLDSGEAFIGDLLEENLAIACNDLKAIEDWRLLRKHGATKIYPGHASPYELMKKSVGPG